MEWECLTPANFSQITKIKGPPERHIEQLWDEIFKLKEKIRVMEETSKFAREK